MKRRWLLYLLVGTGFGVFDFHYQEWTQGLPRSLAAWFAVAWGIWLVPALPIILHESRATRSRLRAGLAAVIAWSAATVSYYLYLIVKLVFIGQATRPELHFSNRGDPFYWKNLASLFLGDVLGGIVEWIAVAVIGGLSVGFLVSTVHLRLTRPTASDPENPAVQPSRSRKSGV